MCLFVCFLLQNPFHLFFETVPFFQLGWAYTFSLGYYLLFCFGTTTVCTYSIYTHIYIHTEKNSVSSMKKFRRRKSSFPQEEEKNLNQYLKIRTKMRLRLSSRPTLCCYLLQKTQNNKR